MATRVPREVLQRTDRCREKMECLLTGQCGDVEDCAVDYADGLDVLFLKSRRPLARCDYRLQFGDCQVCRCPVHFETHRQRVAGQGGGRGK